MNVYDFDGTIYQGDSGIDFIKYAMKKKPFHVSFHLMKALKYLILYQLGKINFSEMKQYIFSFVKDFKSLDEMVDEFAKKNKKKIKKYYLNLRKDDDVIISASLDFYLFPLTKLMGISHVICTQYDVKKGKIIGANCKGEEKVKRLQEVYGKNVIIENAYGDSKNDIPILKMAKKAYMVEGEDLVDFVDNSSFL